MSVSLKNKSKKVDVIENGYESEIQFRERLAIILSREPYNHDVYFHEGKYDKKFSMKNSKGYVDLYMITNKEWPHHGKFPVIGVETKLAKGMGWLIDAVYQVERYKDDLKTAEYYIGGKQVGIPEIFLIATDDSVYTGNVYCWVYPKLRNEDQKEGCWVGITDIFDRVLYRVGAAVLRKNMFQTNYKSESGAVMNYELYT